MILHKFNIHDGYNILTVIVMILSYFIASIIEGSIMKIDELVGVMKMIFGTSSTSWQIYFLAMIITSTFELAFAGMVKYSQDPEIFEELDQVSVTNSRLNGESMKSINKSYGSDDSIKSESGASYTK